MDYNGLAEIVLKFYSNSELVETKLRDLIKKKTNAKKTREIMAIRIEFKHVHMSGKEHLDEMLKKAYLFEFQIVSKELAHLTEMEKIKSLISAIDSQIQKLNSTENATLIEKKTQEKNVLRMHYDELAMSIPQDDKINYNGVAMKILKILERDDDESRKLHRTIKMKVCGTNTFDDLAIRKENLKYLCGDSKKDEKEKIEQMEMNIKSKGRTGGNMKTSYSTNQLTSGYVLPHMRLHKNNGASSTNDFNEFQNDIEVNLNSEEEYPTLGLKSEQKKTITISSGKSFADLVRENYEESEPRKEELKESILSADIEVVQSSQTTSVAETQSVSVDVDDWMIDS